MAGRSTSLRTAAGALTGAALSVAVAAQPAADPGAQGERAAARIRSLQEEAGRLATDAQTVLRDLRQLEIARAIERETLAQADARLAEATAARESAEERLADRRAARIAASPAVAGQLVEIYKRGRAGYLPLLLSSENVRAVGRMSRGLAAVAEIDRVRLDAHRRALETEQAALTELIRRQDALAAARADAARARAGLDAAIEARNRMVEAIARQRNLAAQFTRELQAAQAALEQAAVLASAVSPAPMLPIRPFRGALDWPATGPVVGAFGRAPAGRFGTTILRNGIEIAAAEGTPARAVHEGTVAYAAPFAGFGTLVIVDHGGGAFSLYGHLLDAQVTRGAAVAHGTVVGRVGSSPAGAPALYFELRIDGRPVDPLQWLGRSR